MFDLSLMRTFYADNFFFKFANKVIKLIEILFFINKQEKLLYFLKILSIEYMLKNNVP